MTRRSPEGAFGADDAIPRDESLYACRGTSCHAAGWHGTGITTTVRGTMDLDEARAVIANRGDPRGLRDAAELVVRELDAARARIAELEAEVAAHEADLLALDAQRADAVERLLAQEAEVAARTQPSPPVAARHVAARRRKAGGEVADEVIVWLREMDQTSARGLAYAVLVKLGEAFEPEPGDPGQIDALRHSYTG